MGGEETVDEQSYFSEFVQRKLLLSVSGDNDVCQKSTFFVSGESSASSWRSRVKTVMRK